MKSAAKEAKKAARLAKKEEKQKARAEKKNQQQGSGRKSGSLKKISVFLLVLAVLGGGGFFGYRFYMQKTASSGIYRPVPLPNTRLDDKVLRFTYEVMPNVYAGIIRFNSEIIRIDNEIERIDTIAAQYPDQATLVEKEKKGWETARSRAVKTYQKIEQKLEYLFVALQVNREKGIEAISEAQADLVSTSEENLKALEELTRRLPERETVPPGLIDGTLYKLKKKFLN